MANKEEIKETVDNVETAVPENDCSDSEKTEKEEKEEKCESKCDRKAKKEIAELKDKNAKLEKNVAELNDKYLRLVAEYDNFRKRSAKEKDGVYADAYSDVLTSILPVIDNLERAVNFSTSDPEKVAHGVSMTLEQFEAVLKKLGVEVIPTETFDPNVHNAVMHIEDDSYGENAIVDVFQKGYRKGDKIIRYAMVKVAN